MTNCGNVLLLCEEIDQINFFLRMENALKKNGYNSIFLTANYGIYRKYKNNIKSLILMHAEKYNCNSDGILKSLEFTNHLLDERRCRKLYETTIFYCEKINQENSIDFILGGQGIRVSEMAIRDFASSKKIGILFFELANLPGKLFFDIQGSNAKSYLYSHIDLLKHFEVSKSQYDEWKKTYINNNLQQHIVKQKVNRKKFAYKQGLYTRFGYLFTGLKLRKIDLYAKLKSFILARTIDIHYDNYDINNRQYYFYPMQVSSDSQIILNSDYTVFTGLKKSIEIAKKQNVDLIVKFHPAEKDSEVIKKVLGYRKKYNFKIVNDNTFKVIKNAEKIITINSTIALEAMILGKEVQILGRSYYKYFNDEYLKNYILGYLINIDYFSDEPITEKQILSLIQHYEKITSIEKMARGGSGE